MPRDLAADEVPRFRGRGAVVAPLVSALEPTYPLETERLFLRPFVAEDLDALFAIHSREELTTYLYWNARTRDEVRDVLEKKTKSRAISAPGDVLALAASLKTTNELVGDCILQWIDNEHRQGEIGFIFHPEHHGLGYATEAARVLVRLAFEELKLHRVVGRLEARNRPSARVLEKLGMRREAHLVENEYVKNEWQSEIVYAMLDREWPGSTR